MSMLRVGQAEFYAKLFESDIQGKKFILDAKDYVFKDDRTGEIFGELKPLVQGFEYYVASEVRQ